MHDPPPHRGTALSAARIKESRARLGALVEPTELEGVYETADIRL
jgi:hypothetical protein